MRRFHKHDAACYSTEGLEICVQHPTGELIHDDQHDELRCHVGLCGGSDRGGFEFDRWLRLWGSGGASNKAERSCRQ